MILVVLGTHELPFNRLLNEIDRQIERGNITEKVIVQSGHTKFQSDVMEFIPFVSYSEMDRLYREARLIITHGGTGSITSGVKMGKKLIAVPRLKKYGEHNDDHQLEIVRQFFRTGHLLCWNEGEDFARLLHEIKDFEPVPFVSGKETILHIIHDFIEKKV